MDEPSDVEQYWIEQAVKGSVFACGLIIALTLVACGFGVAILGQAVFN